jgi:hypothetical protein
MNVDDAIHAYITSLPEPKRTDLAALHERMLARFPACQLWFLDGKDELGKVVSNPNLGYGTRTLRYAGGKTREFYRVGLSANTTGISVYIMGIEDKTFLAQTCGARLGKASVTGYCIKFRALQDVALDVLDEVIAFGMADQA